MTASVLLSQVTDEFIHTNGYVKITTLRRCKQYMLCNKYDATLSMCSREEESSLVKQMQVLTCIAVITVFRVLSWVWING